MSDLPPHSYNTQELAYIAQLTPRDRELHELAVKKLASSYFVKRTHGFKKWLAAQPQPIHNTRSQATK